MKKLLPEGKVIFDVMDKVYQSERQKELTEKFQMAIQKNFDWFTKYSADLKPGELLPYHTNLELTESEYKELTNFLTQIELVSSGTIEYEVSYSNNQIFLTPSDTVNYQSVIIDCSSNTVKFDNVVLTFNDTIRIDDPENGFKSEWFGYQWNYEYPTDFEPTNLNDLTNMDLKQYKFNIGYITRTKKAYVLIKGRELSHGFKTIDYDFPLVEVK